MTPQAQVELTVSFGPTSSPLFRRAVAYARAHASTCAEITPGVWRAAFVLSSDPEPYGRAWRLLQVVGSWRGTELEVAGSPEPTSTVLSMAECARAWLRRKGACRASFAAGPWPKCELCPLYDPGWAAESFAAPPFLAEGTSHLEPPPDYPPGW